MIMLMWRCREYLVFILELELDYGDLEHFLPSQVIHNIHVDNIRTKQFSEIVSVIKSNGLRPPYGGHHYFLSI
jgi:hypothetical protein